MGRKAEERGGGRNGRWIASSGYHNTYTVHTPFLLTSAPVYLFYSVFFFRLLLPSSSLRASSQHVHRERGSTARPDYDIHFLDVALIFRLFPIGRCCTLFSDNNDWEPLQASKSRIRPGLALAAILELFFRRKERIKKRRLAQQFSPLARQDLTASSSRYAVLSFSFWLFFVSRRC